jgi:SpoVK/Ycf46/Vps4 family AAA+-type ATPase
MVYVPPPDVASRTEILSIAMRGVPIAHDVDLQALARSEHHSPFNGSREGRQT